jgi:hypothetical protein
MMSVAAYSSAARNANTGRDDAACSNGKLWPDPVDDTGSGVASLRGLTRLPSVAPEPLRMASHAN